MASPIPSEPPVTTAHDPLPYRSVKCSVVLFYLSTVLISLYKSSRSFKKPKNFKIVKAVAV